MRVSICVFEFFCGLFQGGSVTAMAISQGVLLGFVPSGTREVNTLFSRFHSHALGPIHQVVHRSIKLMIICPVELALRKIEFCTVYYVRESIYCLVLWQAVRCNA